MKKPYQKRKEYDDAVLKFIEDNFDGPVEKIPDEEGILHGYSIADGNSGEMITVGWDYVLNQVMYIRTCQPLMAKAAGMPGTEDYD